MNKLPRIEWPTALVLIAGIAAICACIRWHVDPEYVGALALVVFGALANLRKLLKESSADDKEDGAQ